MTAKRVTFVCRDMPTDAQATEFVETIDINLGSSLSDTHRNAKAELARKYNGMRQEQIVIKRIEDIA